jgi:hypothetical protein
LWGAVALADFDETAINDNRLYHAQRPLRRARWIDWRFIEYVLLLTDGVTGRNIDLLRRIADGLEHKSRSVGIDQLLIAGAHVPAIINQRGEFPI